MIPVIALVGRPNVGKSTLFNQLTQKRDALVFDYPGVTRDRQYGEGKLGGKPFIVIDTGGLGGDFLGLDVKMETQSWQAAQEADIIFFILDARDGLTALDEELANDLRKMGKPIFVVINKIDGVNPDVVLGEFASLSVGEHHPVTAAHNRGIVPLIQAALHDYPEEVEVDAEDMGIKVAIVGRPNAGKSTLINRILGVERVVAFDKAGTTRSSIYIPFEHQDTQYTLIDTAGVRRRSRIDDPLEKFSVIKTLQAIEDSHVVILLLDAKEGLAEQDLKLLGFIIEAGKGLVIAVNKWDNTDDYDKKIIKTEIDRRLTFADFARIHFISALHGSGVGELYASVKEAYQAANIKVSTSDLTELLALALEEHQPPAIAGRRIKLRYAHLGGTNPPCVVIHGNQTDKVPLSYKRFLINFFRKHLKLTGTPIRIELKTGDNPYKDKKNTLTPRQQRKRERMTRGKR